MLFTSNKNSLLHAMQRKRKVLFHAVSKWNGRWVCKRIMLQKQFSSLTSVFFCVNITLVSIQHICFKVVVDDDWLRNEEEEEEEKAPHVECSQHTVELRVGGKAMWNE